MGNSVFAERIKLIREKLGLSQEKFAKLVGISRVSLTYYENAKRVPDIFVLRQIYEATGISIYYLLGLSDNERDECVSVSRATGLSEEAIANLRENHTAQKALNTLLVSEYAPELYELMGYMRANSLNAIEAGEVDDEDSFYSEIQERLESRASKLLRRTFCAKSLEDQPIIRDGVSEYRSVRRAYELALGFVPGSFLPLIEENKDAD